jgi:hypothetical protein
MRYFSCLAAVVCCAAAVGFGGTGSVDPSSFKTNARFSVDKTAMSLSTAVATVEPRAGAPGYSWLRIYFYSFPVAPGDLASIVNGNVEPLEKKWEKRADRPADYNTSHAVIQLSMDSAFKVWQVDMSIPGSGCTIAPSEEEVKKFLQEYHFDGKTLRLRSKAAYVCQMKPPRTFRWDINLDIPVFSKAASSARLR